MRLLSICLCLGALGLLCTTGFCAEAPPGPVAVRDSHGPVVPFEAIDCLSLRLCGRDGNRWCNLVDPSEATLTDAQQAHLPRLAAACNLTCVPTILLGTPDPFPPAIYLARTSTVLPFSETALRFAECEERHYWSWRFPFRHRILQPCSLRPVTEEAYECDTSLSKTVVARRTEEVFYKGVRYTGSEALCLQWAVSNLAVLGRCGQRAVQVFQDSDATDASA